MDRFLLSGRKKERIAAYFAETGSLEEHAAFLLEEYQTNRYKGQYYFAVFNPFSGRYYVDDTYGHLPDYAPNAPFAPEKPPKKRRGKER